MPWLLAVIGLLAYQAFALATGRRTLSRMAIEASRVWPLLPFVAGLVVGGLGVHFWWPWPGICP